MRFPSGLVALALSLTASSITGCPSTIPCPDGSVGGEVGCVEADAGHSDADGGTTMIDGTVPGLDAADGGGVDAADDTCPVFTFYADVDDDGYGDAAATMSACAAPDGYVENATDCNDADGAIRPGATEQCDMAMVDENCDESANEGCECFVGQTEPCPGQSEVGECVAGTRSCDTAGRWLACTGTVGPMSETCDGRDNDCNDTIDNGAASACGAVANGTAACATGACSAVCAATHGNCDARFDTGCETALGTASNCSACGDSCGWSCASRVCNDATQLALGYTFVSGHASCAVRSSGTAVCWGENGAGQLGRGTAGADSAIASAVMGLSGRIDDIAVGLSHTCALIAGQVYCWGEGSGGELGNGMNTDSVTPVRVAGLTDAMDIAAGLDFTCAVRAVGTVVCWGENGARQLCDGTTTDRNVPVVATTVGSNAVRIDASTARACVTLTTGDVRCWGGGLVTAATTLLTGDASQVAVGEGHTCALYRDITPSGVGAGGVGCWGDNDAGQLGDGTTTVRTGVVNVSVFTRGSLPDASDGYSATDLSAEGDHTCAVGEDGRLFCWGGNSSGQVGPGPNPQTTPIVVAGTGTVADVEAGYRYTCARDTSDVVRCWGANASGECGTGSISASPITPTVVRAP